MRGLNGASRKLTDRMFEIRATIDVLTNLPRDIGIHYGRIRTRLESASEVIEPNDVLIAAHA